MKKFHDNFPERDCTDDDYKFWSPGSSDGPHMPCILGRKETYQRRIPHSMCYNGKDFDAPVKKETCECDDEDFEW
jgi:sortilin-related receptor